VDSGTAAHWDRAYGQGEDSRSWYQDRPVESLRMLDAAGVRPEHGVLDVGGGAARLVDALLHRGYADLSVLDVSATGLGYARARLGAAADRVRWLVADVREWRPDRRFHAWHDRAVFHFLTTADDRGRYLATLREATAPGSVAVFGCFAPDGPPSCSGLPVARYDPAGLADTLGPGWHLVTAEREEHTTPAARIQPFTWAAFRRYD